MNNKSILNETKSSLDGFSLAITFIICSIFLSINNLYFNDSTAKSIFIIIFNVIGGGGMFVEADKIFKKYNMLGLNEIGAGFVFFIIGLLPLFWKMNLIFRIAFFFILLFSIYCIVSGLIFIIYSIFTNKKVNKENCLRFLITFLSILLAILQIIVAITELSN